MNNFIKILEIQQNHTTITTDYTYRETILILICIFLFLIALSLFFLIIFLGQSKNKK